MAATAAVLAVALTQFVHTARHQPPGVARLAHSVPLLMAFSLTPTRIPYVTLRGTLGFILAWLGNAKVREDRATASFQQRGTHCRVPVPAQVISFAADRGPLAHPELSTAQFIPLLIAPVCTSKPARQDQQRAGAPPPPRRSQAGSALLLLLKAAAHCAITYLVTSPHGLPVFVLHSLYAAYIYLMVRPNLQRRHRP